MTPEDPCDHLAHVNATKIAALEKELHLHVKYQQDSVQRATTELQKRLDGMNEFRDALKDAQARYFTKDEYAAHHNPLVDDISSLKNKISNWEGRIYVVVGAATTIAGLIGAAIMAFADRIIGTP